MSKKIVFLSGTRADYGKIKSIMKKVDRNPDFDLHVFVTGMHMLKMYGKTYKEIQKDGYSDIWLYINQFNNSDMDTTLAQTILGFSAYIKETQPDMIVVHGDRLEAMAGAIVAAMNNILLAHIEGGEVSGTIDESLRHAISKLAQIHFVSNDEAKRRLVQLGEKEENIYVIGSPDIDIMLSDTLPTWGDVKERYNIEFDDFLIAMFHPVTTDYLNMPRYSSNFVDAMLKTENNYLIIQPNNDSGREFISAQYERLKDNKRFKILPSMRFEYFLTALKNSKCIIGNSSAGIRESGVYSIPAVDIGTRQKDRYSKSEFIINCGYEKKDIIKSISLALNKTHISSPQLAFGIGDSAEKFMDIISRDGFWNTTIQKHFVDIEW